MSKYFSFLVEKNYEKAKCGNQNLTHFNKLQQLRGSWKSHLIKRKITLIRLDKSSKFWETLFITTHLIKVEMLIGQSSQRGA